MNLQRLLPIYLAAVIGPMGGVGIITLLPVLAGSWNISIQWISLTVTPYMIPYIVFQLFSGSIAHIFNTRKTFLFGFGVYSLGGLLSGLSPGLETLAAARFIQGLGAAFITPIVMALVGEMVDPKHLGKAIGLQAVDYTYEKYILIFALFGTGSAAAWASLNTLAVQAVPELRKPATSVYNSFKFTGYALAPLTLSFLYIPFSISAVRWACVASILMSLIFTSRIRSQMA